MKSAPDGYTLMIGATSTMAANPSLYTKMNLDPPKDLTPITQVASGPFVLAVPASLPVRTVKELIALARNKPGEINFGSSGVGSSLQLTAELFKSMANIDIVHVPYKGLGPALADLVSGRIHIIFSDMAGLLPFVQSGQLRALGVTSAQRFSDLPGSADARGGRRAGLRGDLVVRISRTRRSAARHRCEAQSGIDQDRAEPGHEGKVRVVGHRACDRHARRVRRVYPLRNGQVARRRNGRRHQGKLSVEPTDYGPFRYVPITRRPKIVWPGDAQLALWVIPNIEFFSLRRAVRPSVRRKRAGTDSASLGPARLRQSCRHMAHHGRAFEAEYPRSTASINADICVHHPQIVKAGVELGWEFMGHNLTNNGSAIRDGAGPGARNDQGQSAIMIGGRRPWASVLSDGSVLRWRRPGTRSNSLMDENFEYVADWTNDDQPYVMSVGGREIVSIPYSYELNNSPFIYYRNGTIDEFEKTIRCCSSTCFNEEVPAFRTCDGSLSSSFHHRRSSPNRLARPRLAIYSLA